MIEQNVKTSPWQRVVTELSSPAPDDRAYLARLVNVLWQVSSARQAVLYVVDSDEVTAEPRPILVWPHPTGDPSAAIESAPEQRSAARAAVETGGLHIQMLNSSGGPYYGEGGDRSSILALPIETNQGEPGVAPRLAVTLLLEPRSRQALQTTAALAEVLTGYTQLHTSRQQLRRIKASSAALDLAARLIASINTSRGFKGAAMQLVNDLSRHLHADRAAIGWVRGIGTSGEVRVVSISDTEHVDARMAMVQKLQAAMDECLDQEQPVMYPPPSARGDGEGQGEADVLLSQAITHAHRELSSADARLRVASMPLRIGDRVLGVVTIESTTETVDVAAIELMQAALDLVAPVLEVRRSDDRLVATRFYFSIVRGGEWFVGPKHTVWKMVALLALAGGAALTFINVPYRVEATMELQPRMRHIVASPFDGIVLGLPEGIEAGRMVEAGQLLVQLDTQELLLQHAQAMLEVDHARREAEMHRQQRKIGEAQQAESKAESARARADLIELQLSLSQIKAPIGGTIIAGDLRDRIGSAIKLGDPLFQIAPLDEMKVIAQVSDRDIALIRDARSEKGATKGAIATKAFPGVTFPFEVERIVPLAQAKDGKNAFEVHGRLEESADWLKPGMEGLAKLDTGSHSLLYIGTRRIRDQLRLWLWW